MINKIKNINSQINPKLSKRIVLFFLFIVGMVSNGFAVPPGTLDSAFGTSGIVLRDVSTADDEVFAVTIQPDNKIVTVGYSGTTAEFTVCRFNANGTSDTTFGTNGLVQTSFSIPNSLVNDDSLAYAVALQSDGKILVGGDIGPGLAFGMARYTSNGQLDTSFGNGGKVITNVQNLAGIRGISMQNDGKIIAVGYTKQISDFVVVRYTNNGLLDTSFGGGDGIVITDFFGDTDIATAVKLQSDGKVLVAGSAVDADLLVDFAIARYNIDGSLDTTFNGIGLKTIFTECGPEMSGCGIDALGIQPDGKIAVVGSNDDIYLARFNTDGSQLGGVIPTNVGGSSDKAFSLAIDLVGGIFVAGSTISAGNEDFFVAKYQSSGTLDTTFDDGDGIVTTNLGSNSDIGHAIAFQPNGGIIVGGSKGNFGSKEFAVVRYVGLQPSAANAMISGRVMSSNGLGIRNVRMSLTNAQGGTFYSLTNPFGYYRFEAQAGGTYVITPNSKTNTFTPASRVITLSEDIAGMDFTSSN
jgi:uncharacterized delta-60 repeat protein